jgi:hypothetical protein
MLLDSRVVGCTVFCHHGHSDQQPARRAFPSCRAPWWRERVLLRQQGCTNMTSHLSRPVFAGSIVAGALAMFVSTAGGAATGGAVGTTTAAPVAALAQLNCPNLSRTTVKSYVSAVGQNTTSTTPVTLATSRVNFTLPSTGCVIIEFSGQGWAPGASHVMFVQAVLDGTTVSPQGEIQFVAESGNSSDAHAYHFHFANVPAGLHNVRMQFRSNTSTAVFMNDFTMIVRYP